MKQAIILWAIAGLSFLAGCSTQADKAGGIPVGPKWKGAPYRLAVDTKPAKPNPAGITIPAIDYTANPDALERRATLVVRFDSSGAVAKNGPAQNGPLMDQLVVGPFDISGAQGALPADYMDVADKGLARLLGAYGMKGKIKLSLAIARSSLSPQADDSELDAKRLSDWLPVEVVFKNLHPAH